MKQLSLVLSIVSNSMSTWIEFTREELELIRRYCFKSLFIAEDVAYSGIESGYTPDERQQAQIEVDLNHALISKLYVN